MAVGPPQPQSFAVCTVPSPKHSISTRQSQTIQIRFDGDIPAKGETYSETIPTDGTTFIIGLFDLNPFRSFLSLCLQGRFKIIPAWLY